MHGEWEVACACRHVSRLEHVCVCEREAGFVEGAGVGKEATQDILTGENCNTFL